MTNRTLDGLQQLPTWLAAAGIARLELEGPGLAIRLRRGPAPAEAAPASLPAPAPAAAAPAPAVTAPFAGVLLHRHPQREAELAPVGTRVAAGQPVALLQVGALLLPVRAPRAGRVQRRLAEAQAVVGYAQPLLELSDEEPA